MYMYSQSINFSHRMDHGFQGQTQKFPKEIAQTLASGVKEQKHLDICSKRYTQMGSSKGVSCVACRSFCSCSVTCSIVLNVTVTFEQKLKLYSMLVLLCCMQFVAVTNCRDFPVIISVACQCFQNGLLPHLCRLMSKTLGGPHK